MAYSSSGLFFLDSLPLLMPYARKSFAWFLGASVVGLLRFFSIYFLIAHDFSRFGFIFSILLVCKMLFFMSLHALLLHQQRYVIFKSHIQALLHCFIYSKFGRLVMLSGLTRWIFLLMRLFIGWFRISGLLVLPLVLSYPNWKEF